MAGPGDLVSHAVCAGATRPPALQHQPSPTSPDNIKEGKSNGSVV